MGCFSWKRKPELVFLPNTMNAQRYVRLLEDHLEPFGDAKHTNRFRFQRDNAKSHTAKITHQYFVEAGVSVLSWPSKSPDLNPIENLRAQVVRDVYSNFRHFDCEDDLCEAIEAAWDRIELESLRNLISSMANGCLKVIEKRGGPTGY